MNVEKSLAQAIKELRLSIIIFTSEYAYTPWCFDEFFRIILCTHNNMKNADYPVSFDFELLNLEKQNVSWTIVFDKDEDDFREKREKVQKWENILDKVNSSWEAQNSQRIIRTLIWEATWKRHRSLFMPEKTGYLVGQLDPIMTKTRKLSEILDGVSKNNVALLQHLADLKNKISELASTQRKRKANGEDYSNMMSEINGNTECNWSDR